MDLGKIQRGGEWLELEAIDERIGKMRFLVRPLSPKDQKDFLDMLKEGVDKSVDKISDLVLDWDMTKDGQPFECSEENKDEYMPYIIPIAVKGKEPEKKEFVGDQIIEFAGNIGNFIKN